jgi:hypothetical protein
MTKYNSFGPKYYDRMVPQLRASKTLADFRVFNTRVTDTQPWRPTHAAIPNPTASWRMAARHPPRREFQLYTTRIGGHILHVWRYYGWELKQPEPAHDTVKLHRADSHAVHTFPT